MIYIHFVSLWPKVFLSQKKFLIIEKLLREEAVHTHTHLIFILVHFLTDYHKPD